MLQPVTAATVPSPRSPGKDPPVVTSGKIVTAASVRKPRERAATSQVATVGAAVTTAPPVPSALAAVTA